MSTDPKINGHIRKYQRQWPFAYVLVALALLNSGCTTPASRFAQSADSQGLIRIEDRAGPFVHVRFHNGRAEPGRPVHIYFDGDGDPATRSAAGDPTTNERLVLKLIATDPGAAFLIGRPCYYLLDSDPRCDPSLWTSKRYSREVIDSIANAVRRVVAGLANSPVTLIGYSGGGAIVGLIAARLPQVERVITVAANLDIDAWAAHHGSTAPLGSLNPADVAPLPAAIAQWHLYGSRDQVVPASTAERYLAKQNAARMSVVGGYDHRCCWEQIWNDVLAGRFVDVD